MLSCYTVQGIVKNDYFITILVIKTLISLIGIINVV